MIKTKKLNSTEQRKLKKLDKQLLKTRQNKQFFIDEEKDLKKQKALILCPFSIGEEVIRDNGERGKVSKIVLEKDLPIISVFKQTKFRRKFQYNYGEHYRTKPNEVWNLLN